MSYLVLYSSAQKKKKINSLPILNAKHTFIADSSTSYSLPFLHFSLPLIFSFKYALKVMRTSKLNSLKMKLTNGHLGLFFCRNSCRSTNSPGGEGGEQGGGDGTGRMVMKGKGRWCHNGSDWCDGVIFVTVRM